MRVTRFDAGAQAMRYKHRFLHACALLTLWLSLTYTAAASADDYELGRQALESGHSAQTIELWRPLAEAGDADAQFGLGILYNDAIGVEQDYAEANYWFLRAAEQGYAMAQFNLGNAYKNGTGMTIDPAMAVIWWRKAAEQDFAPAQFNLGSALLEGFGTPRDRAAGLSWYRRAAANGHPQAQRNLELHKDTAASTDAKPSTRPAATPTPTRNCNCTERNAGHSRQQCKTAEYAARQTRRQSTHAGRDCAIRRLQRLARSGYQHAHRATHGQPNRDRSPRLRRAARIDSHRHLQLSDRGQSLVCTTLWPLRFGR